MVKSIEPDIRSWANITLRTSDVKMSEEQGYVDKRIPEALKLEPSKQGGVGDPRTDAQVLIKVGDTVIPTIIEYKGTKGRTVLLNKQNLVILKNSRGEFDFKKAIPSYAVNGACYYASVIVKHTDFNEVLAVGVNGYPEGVSTHYEVSAYIVNSDNPELPIKVGDYPDLSFLLTPNQPSLLEKIENVQMNPEEVHAKALYDDERLDKVLKDLNQKLRDETKTWIIHLGIGDMKSHLAGLKATFGSLRILTERRSW